MVRKENTFRKHVSSLAFSFLTGTESTEMVDTFLEQRFSLFHAPLLNAAVHSSLVSRYPRRSYCLSSSSETVEKYGRSLREGEIEYYDFFAVNVSSSSLLKKDEISFYLEEKKRGRIGHIGLECAGEEDDERRIEEAYGFIEYVILPLSSADAVEKNAGWKIYEKARSLSLPVFVSASRLNELESSLSDEKRRQMKERHPSWNAEIWELRFLHSLDGVVTVIVPFENISLVRSGVKALRRYHSLTEEERVFLLQ
jgi:uncharacterized protein